MKTNRVIFTYKREILIAAFSALVTAVLSLAIGLFSLNQSFELNQKKDLLYGLKTDIALLKNVERELDTNLNLLLNQDFKISVTTQQIPAMKWPATNKSDEKFARELNDYMSNMLGGGLSKVTQVHVPPNKFVVDAWKVGGPQISDIDFELIQELNELYRGLNRCNEFIKNMGAVSEGITLPVHSINSMNNSIPEYNKLIGEVSQKKILKLKNDIARELIRLNKERSRIVF